MRKHAKVDLATVKETLKIKTTALRELQDQQAQFASQRKGLSILDKLRNFAHEKFALGERIQNKREQFLSSPNQVVALLSLEGEQRILTGEIEKIQQDAMTLEAQVSKKSAVRQSVAYWGDKIIQGLSRREELGRAAQVQQHSIPGNPVVLVQMAQDFINALLSVREHHFE